MVMGLGFFDGICRELCDRGLKIELSAFWGIGPGTA